MALPIPPISPNNPIPNDPFYYPETNYIKGEYGPFIVGSGLFIDNVTGVISASGGGGGGGITVLTGTPPISVTGTASAKNVSIATASTTSLGAVQLYDGVNNTSTSLALTAAQGFNLQQQINALTVASNLTLAGTFNASSSSLLTVTQGGTLAGFTVGSNLPLPSAGNRDHFVIATVGGTYTPPGSITPITVTPGDWLLSDGTQWNLLDVGASFPYATTSVAGIVCLSTNALAQAGTDTLTALTPATAASAFIPKSCVIAKGSLITGTAANTPTALPVGTNGQYLVANSLCATGLEWVTSAAGGGMGDTPVGSINFFSGTSAPTGWMIADGSAVSRTVYSALFSAIGTTFGAGDGTNTFNLPDLRGMFLRGWDAAGGSARGCDPGRAFGSTQQGEVGPHNHLFCFFNAAFTFADGNYIAGQQGTAAITTNSSADRQAFCSIRPNTGVETRPVNVALLPCIKWQVTTAPSSCGIPCACVTSKGAIITGNAPNVPVALPAGTDGQYLVACSAAPTGLCWIGGASGTYIPTSCVVGKGGLVTGTGPSTPAALPVGTNGQILGANSACASGLQWQTGAVGPWISAGTIQSVGLSATTTAPVLGSSSRNNVSYRQIGPKEWEVVYVFASSSNYTPGDGDWLFSLPGGLQFDTTLAWQPINQQYVQAHAQINRLYSLPGPSQSQVAFTHSGNASTFGAGPSIWDTTRWRFMTSDGGNSGWRAIGSYYWGNDAALTFITRFQFTSL